MMGTSTSTPSSDPVLLFRDFFCSMGDFFPFLGIHRFLAGGACGQLPGD